MAVSGAAALLGVGALAAALRLVPGLLWRYRGADTGFHLFLRREIRRRGLRVPTRLDPLVLDDRLVYPWAFHWFAALVPDRWLARVPPLTSAVADAAQALLVAWMAMTVAPLVDGRIAPVAAGLVAGALLATAPALLVVGIGPRAFEITPRPFGELTFAAMMVAAGWHLQGGSLPAALMAALAGGLTLLSSKFAAQALVFSIPFAALIAGTARPLLLLPLAFVSAMLISRGRYWGVAQAQWLHLRLYRRRIQSDHSEVRDRNRWSTLAGALVDVLRRPAEPGARRALVRAAEQNAVLQFLLRNVLLIGVIVAIVASHFNAWAPAADHWRRWLVGWAVAPVIPFLVVSLHRFRFLGEAERYPEYGIAAAAVLGGIGFLQLPPVPRALLGVAYLVLLLPPYGYTVARLRWNSRRVGASELDELATFLKARPGCATILPLPWHPIMQLLPELEHRHLITMDGAVWFRTYDRLFLRYPWPHADLDAWRSVGADLVVLDWVRAAAEGVHYPVETLHLRFENARYRVYDWTEGPA